eukprot:TRINITY_DN5547_c0_g1_i14.p1 TRINITY_DN5547_c0_g1~~TRINITY_DN5547_c0_g1_i14.p1  ORF type:complete len:250 (-),score=15.19 TRINITY_DN5547_c0_g1_i14:124-873(-)
MADTDNTSQTQSRGIGALKNHLISHKLDVGLWVTRLATILFSFAYILPVIGNPTQSFYKALMANAATSALRLHQRQTNVPYTTLSAFIQQILTEDSAHYLMYSLIFLYSAPITIVLVPVFLFALLHAASYSLTLLDTLGQNSWWGARLLISFVELQSRNMLRMIAFNEIFLMPMLILFIFSGQASLVTPLVYVRFLSLRYESRRNPYCRTMFHELRLAMEHLASKPGCPSLVRSLIYKMIGIVSRMASS